MPTTRRQGLTCSLTTTTTTTRTATSTSDGAVVPLTPPRSSQRAKKNEVVEKLEPATPDPPPSSSYIFDGVSYPTYQEMVNAKRKRNQEVLHGLGFLESGSGGSGLSSSKKQATQRGIKKQKTAPAPPGPRRKSSRLSSSTTEDANQNNPKNLVALDYYVKDWNRNMSVVQVEGGDGVGGGDKNDDIRVEPEKPKFYRDRLNDGSEMTLKDSIESMNDKWIQDDSVEVCERFIQKDLASLKDKGSLEYGSKTRNSPTSVMSAYLEKELTSLVEDLSIDKEEWVAKVTPDRIYSVAAHPSEQKLIACAGDKWGYIGLWDVDAPSSDNDDAKGHSGVHLFRVHSRPICGLQWANHDTMISASYDGTIRRLNVETGTFQEVFASYDDSDSYYAEELGFGMDQGYNFWHQHVSVDHRYVGSDPCLFLATSVGTAVHLDLRVTGKHRVTFNEKLSEKKLNTLSLHPNGHTLASAGNDGTVNLWDIRKFGSSRNSTLPKAVATQTVGLSINSSYFSPSGGSLLSTSFANKIDLVDDAHTLKGSIKPTKSIVHNNQTGRWLSTFMACWHPKQDIFVSGSMKKPRCMEIFDSRGKLLRAISGESLTAVTSRCCFHPSTSQLIMIGGNSSGRVVAVR